MMKKIGPIILFTLGASLLIAAIVWSSGSGAFKRQITFSGIYAVCKPSGYDAVCFMDADSKDGGLSCIPFTGACK